MSGDENCSSCGKITDDPEKSRQIDRVILDLIEKKLSANFDEVVDKIQNILHVSKDKK